MATCLGQSGKTLRACPRCFALTADFHKYPTEDTDIRTASNMKWLCCMGRDLLEKPECNGIDHYRRFPAYKPVDQHAVSI